MRIIKLIVSPYVTTGGDKKCNVSQYSGMECGILRIALIQEVKMRKSQELVKSAGDFCTSVLNSCYT